MFVFPSLCEGFGIPLVEAFSMGCPVACSRIPPFEEVTEDSAVYFDPTDTDSIYDCVKELLLHATLRRELADRGFERARAFSWTRSAELTARCYLKML